MKFNSKYKILNDHRRLEWLKREKWERRERKRRNKKGLDHRSRLEPAGPWFPHYEDGLFIVPEKFCKSPDVALDHARKMIESYLDIDPDEKCGISIEQTIDERGHVFYFEKTDRAHYNGETTIHERW